MAASSRASRRVCGRGCVRTCWTAPHRSVQRRLSPRAANVGEDGCDLRIVQHSPCAGIRPIGAFLAVQQDADRHAGRANHARRSGDIRRRARLLSTIGAMTPLADILVDFLPGGETVSVRPRSAAPQRAQRRLSRPTDARHHLCRAVAELAFFVQRRATSAGSRVSVTRRSSCPRRRCRGICAFERTRKRARATRLRLVRRDMSDTAHSDRRRPGSACPGIVAASNATSAPRSSADRCQVGARCFLHARASSACTGASSPSRTIVAASMVMAADRCGVSPSTAAADRAPPARCRAAPLIAASTAIGSSP